MSLVPARLLQHRKQTTNNNCVATCLSIVTDEEIESISDEMNKDGFSEPCSAIAAIRFLARRGIHAERMNGVIGAALIDNSVYLATCPSSVNPAKAHMIVVAIYAGTGMIFDPNDDLDDRKNYSHMDFDSGNIPVFEYYLLTDCNLL